MCNIYNTSKWKLFYQKILQKYGDSLLFECNISNNILHAIANENIFLSSVLSAWSNVTHNLETQTNSKTILWNNKDITSNNKTFFINIGLDKTSNMSTNCTITELRTSILLIIYVIYTEYLQAIS